jgi:hypothetical protein
MDKAETVPYDAGIAEYFFDLCWTRRAGYVKILRLLPEDKIAHRASHNVGFVACGLESFNYVNRIAVHIGRIDTVLVTGIHDGFFDRLSVLPG